MGDLREAGLDNDRPEDISAETYAEYQTRSEAGQCSSNIWRDESGVFWFSMEH
jgi:hypothetical protein